jgi:hypothetical protein
MHHLSKKNPHKIRRVEIHRKLSTFKDWRGVFDPVHYQKTIAPGKIESLESQAAKATNSGA